MENKNPPPDEFKPCPGQCGTQHNTAYEAMDPFCGKCGARKDGTFSPCSRCLELEMENTVLRENLKTEHESQNRDYNRCYKTLLQERERAKQAESRLAAQAGELEFAIAVIREETGWTDEEVRPWIQKRALAALPAPQESVPGECQDCVGPGVKVCPDCSRCVEHCEHMPACLPGCAFSGPHTGLCMVNHPPESGKGEA